ncbi:hypothetical protein ACFL02_01775 [Planctomycetota bacterium]
MLWNNENIIEAQAEVILQLAKDNAELRQKIISMENNYYQRDSVQAVVSALLKRIQQLKYGRG